MEGCSMVLFNIIFYLIIFGLPIILPIGIVKILSFFSKDKKAYYHEYKPTTKKNNKDDDIVSDCKVASTPKPTFINITKCPYCESENSWYKGECKNCGAREVTRIRKEVSYI